MKKYYSRRLSGSLENDKIDSRRAPARLMAILGSARLLLPKPACGFPIDASFLKEM